MHVMRRVLNTFTSAAPGDQTGTPAILNNFRHLNTPLVTFTGKQHP